MTRYQIFGVHDDYTSDLFMQATAQIEQGHEILAERPLIRLNVKSSDVDDPDRLLDATDRLTGACVRDLVENRISGEKRCHFDALYDKTENNTIAGRIQTNSFEEIVTGTDGETCTTLRIYNDISRVNHSCRPNAVVNYNRKFGVGSLRAITAIAAGEEIFIDYISDEMKSLQPRDERQALLWESWAFECDCTACSLDGRALDEDDNRRTKALELFEDVSEKYWYFGSLGGENRQKTDRGKKAQEYGLILTRLGLVDARLAYAYHVRSEVEHDLWKVAKKMIRETGSHCALCTQTGVRRTHLEAARQAKKTALAIDRKTYGRFHQQVDRSQNELEFLVDLLKRSWD